MKKFIRERLQSWGQLGAWLIFGVALSLASLASAEVLRQAIAAIEAGEMGRLRLVALLAAFATLWTIAFEYLKRVTGCRLHNRYEAKLQTQLFTHTLRLNKLDFLNKRAGETLTLLQTNAACAVEGMMDTLAQAVYGTGVLLFSLVYMGLLSLPLTLIVAACNLLFRLCTRFLDKKIRALSKRVIRHVGESNSFFMEVLYNALILRVYQKEDAFEELFREKEEETARAGLSAFALRNGYDELTWFTLKLIELLVVYGVGGLLLLRGAFPFSVITAFTMASNSFTKGMNAVIDAVNEYNSTLPHIEAIEKELAIPCEEEQGERQPPAFGDIVFRDVCFAFPDKPVFDRLSFTVHAGDRVLVTGANGRGKSTLFSLLLGFYRPQGGSITIGGADIADYPCEALCRLFSYIPQQPYILPGSVDQNLALAQPVEEQKVGRLLHALHLLPIRGLDPLRCSMGERQRLGIGRALYQGEQRPVLLGDEIFANVDSANREAILQALKGFCAGKTVFLICHEKVDFPFTHRLHLGEDAVSYTPVAERAGIGMEEVCR